MEEEVETIVQNNEGEKAKTSIANLVLFIIAMAILAGNAVFILGEFRPIITSNSVQALAIFALLPIALALLFASAVLTIIMLIVASIANKKAKKQNKKASFINWLFPIITVAIIIVELLLMFVF